jgi:hypothetical protein
MTSFGRGRPSGSDPSLFEPLIKRPVAAKVNFYLQGIVVRKSRALLCVFLPTFKSTVRTAGQQART